MRKKGREGKKNVMTMNEKWTEEEVIYYEEEYGEVERKTKTVTTEAKVFRLQKRLNRMERVLRQWIIQICWKMAEKIPIGNLAPTKEQQTTQRNEWKELEEKVNK